MVNCFLSPFTIFLLINEHVSLFFSLSFSYYTSLASPSLGFLSLSIHFCLDLQSHFTACLLCSSNYKENFYTIELTFKRSLYHVWSYCTFAFWFKHSVGGSSVVSKSPLAISSSSLTSSVRVSSRQTSRPPIFLALSKIFPFSSCKQHSMHWWEQIVYMLMIAFKYNEMI